MIPVFRLHHLLHVITNEARSATEPPSQNEPTVKENVAIKW